MKTIFLKYCPLFLGLLFLLIAYFTLLLITFFQNGNHLVYSLDDAYIHMAMAKNFVRDGIWGVSRYEFASSSSSVLWTLLLALIYFLFGVNEITPLILNVVFASLVIISSYFILRKYGIHSKYIAFILLSLVIITPLPPLMFTGLEHVFHIWISLLFIFLVSEILTENNTTEKKILWLIILAAMLPMIRYEGIFLIIIASVLLISKRKFVTAILIIIFSLVPIIIFGVISVKNGWSFFPNSLLLKGSFPDITSLMDFINFSEKLINIFLPGKLIVFIILTLLTISGVIYLISKSQYATLLNMKITYLIFLFGINLVLYAAYSKSGWSYRYQSFLVALGIVIFSILLFEFLLNNLRKKFILKSVLIMILIILPLVYFLIEGIKINIQTPQASTNIYEQQYQMGQFLKKYYPGEGVALNDIGASNYLADIKCVDLWGLANLEISQKRRSGRFETEDIRKVCEKNNVKIAIVYDSWFKNGDKSELPGEWLKAGTWTIENNVIAGDSVVSFYAVKDNEFTKLSENLKAFQVQLPKGVIQTYLLSN